MKSPSIFLSTFFILLFSFLLNPSRADARLEATGWDPITGSINIQDTDIGYTFFDTITNILDFGYSCWIGTDHVLISNNYIGATYANLDSCTSSEIVISNRHSFEGYIFDPDAPTFYKIYLIRPQNSYYIDTVSFIPSSLPPFSPSSPNKVPSIETLLFSSDTILVNSPISASTNFTDENQGDTHTAIIDWGDGSTDTCTVTESNGSGTVTCDKSTPYTAAHVYEVKISVSDGSVSEDSPVEYASVYAPTPQGIFSAGQKFTAAAGGNVIFGLSYKYQGTVPTGNRQFSMDYNQGNIHFQATTVNALIINSGMATLTGKGRYNGTANYEFLVTGDENTNKVRIQIKDPLGDVVYDTQPGAANNAAPTTTVTGNIIAH